MRRRSLLSLSVACTLAACAHQTPTAMPGMSWSLNQVDGEGAKLAFGQPQSDNVVLMMSCQPRSGEVTVSVNGAASAPAPTLQLTSGGRTTRKTGEAGPSGFGEGQVIETALPASDPVLASFARTGDLAVTAGGRRTALPAAPKAEASRFVASCRTA